MSFDQTTINAVWEKAQEINGYDSNIYRKDYCGAWIEKDKYGDRNHAFGWEIDHETTKANGGDDSLSNLRPLHWRNNASRGNGRLNTQTPAAKSVGNQNHYLDDDGHYYAV
ncbi:HNH endonuclease signature motif containing protein [Dickeya undicola]|uniref:HNH endonuclease signature motif containing protein n=1 Tax=Dickeya undicola TaxID=1577887 RepID=UPI000532EF85|nr:HNH endonuclease signature motif containing protein [Dickeya undicola]